MKNRILLFTFCWLILSSFVSADSFEKTIRVFSYPIHFYFDGIKDEGNRATYFNGTKDVPLSFIYEGTTYVPLRYVSEKLGKDVGWDEKTYSIWVGKKPTSINSDTQSTIIDGVKLYQSEQEVLSLLGPPQRKDPSILGFEWWIYNKDYKQYLQIGIKDHKVVELYSNAPNWELHNVKIGMSKADVGKKYTLSSTVSFMYDGAEFTLENDLLEKPIVLINDSPVIFYLDKHNQDKVTGIRWLTKENLIKSNRYSMSFKYRGEKPDHTPPYLSATEQIRINQANERQIFDLVNVIRLRNNLSILSWNEQAAEVARSHSLDMLANDYFSHTSATTGFDPFQRLKQAGISYLTAGENIAMGYSDAIDAHEAWMNSEGHRKNILNKDFKTLGVGVQKQYYTQNFVTLLE